MTGSGSEKAIPLAYLITFTCYGTRLHGHEDGSVDREHNLPGSPFLPPNPRRVQARTLQMKSAPRKLSAGQRTVVLEAIRAVCEFKGWKALAVHVRTSHVHAVIAARERPERVMTAAKARSSLALHERTQNCAAPLWTRHGSTRYLWKPEQVAAAIRYVADGQGEVMALWVNPEGL